MEDIRNFLELSTIHGLYYISHAKKCARIFWILVVFCGFAGAGFLMYESFYNWEQSPISTTIETLPITQITFPNVTVCPPKQSFLTLNYDVMNSEKVNIDEKTRKELFSYALSVIQEDVYGKMMTNLSKFEDSNWPPTTRVIFWGNLKNFV